MVCSEELSGSKYPLFCSKYLSGGVGGGMFAVQRSLVGLVDLKGGSM